MQVTLSNVTKILSKTSRISPYGQILLFVLIDSLGIQPFLLKNFIMFSRFNIKLKKRCKKCGKQYLNDEFAKLKWCKPCQINKNFTASGNEIIDNFIQEMHLKINHYDDVIF